MTRYTTLIFSVLALLLTFAGASAQLSINVITHDTDVQSTYNELKVCSCGGQTDVIKIKNIGALESIYRIEIESDRPWFTLDKTSAILAPGASDNVYVFTTAPCGAVGTGYYTVYVASEYGRYRAIDKTMQTGVCENIKLALSSEHVTVQPCAKQPFTLTLTNVATFTEDYTVEGLGFPGVTLAAGESANLTGNYTASCSGWGTTEIPVTVRSKLNEQSVTRIVTVDVPRAYDYEIALGTIQQPVCAGVTTSVPVTVKNLEDRANTVTLTTSQATEATNVVIPAHQSVRSALSFTPSSSGSTTFAVKGEGLNGSIEKKVKLEVPVEACYGFTMTAPRTVSACPGSLQVPFTIESDGSRVQDLSFDVLSNTTTSTNGIHAALRPGERLTKTVDVTVPDADRQYYVTLNTTSAYAKEESTVTIKGWSTEACYRVTPASHKYTVWTDQEVLPVIISQSGLAPATYVVRYQGTFITPYERELTLASGQQTVLHLVVNSTGHENGLYIDRLTLSAHGIDYTTDFAIQLREKGFWENFVDQCRWNNGFAVCSVTSSASLIIFLVLLIIAIGMIAGVMRYEHPTRHTKELVGTVGGIILIILLIAMIMSAPTIPRTYERPIAPVNSSALAYEIGQGQTITLDINQYFKDPDNNKLTFTASQSPNLRIQIKNGNATIEAANDWSGTETVVFTANDGHGGYADSDLFQITVVPYRPVTFLEYWTRACWFLTWAFLFLAVAIAIMIVLFTKKQRESAIITNKERERHITKSKGTELTPLERELLDRQLHEGEASKTLNQLNASNIIINQAGAVEQLWVASSSGTKFHRMTCPQVKGISKDKRTTFTSRDEAIKAGYSPCKTCSSQS